MKGRTGLKEKTKETLLFIVSIVLIIVVVGITRFSEKTYFILPFALVLIAVLYLAVWRREIKKSKARMEKLQEEGIVPRSKK